MRESGSISHPGPVRVCSVQVLRFAASRQQSNLRGFDHDGSICSMVIAGDHLPVHPGRKPLLFPTQGGAAAKPDFLIMAKLNFDDALERLNDERCVNTQDVHARALRRVVWVTEWHVPGCISQSQSICLTKSDAIESALDMANSPRGMRADLLRYGQSGRVGPDAYFRMATTTVSRTTLGSLL